MISSVHDFLIIKNVQQKHNSGRAPDE
jgi:hypothetical protein